ncbi:MAG: tsp3, partial [Chlamydiia bacterium]|nr:tsp3 [Chlamydiia bacterium]
DAEKMAMQRIAKRREKIEEEFCSKDKKYTDQVLCTYILKAFTSSLDAHTNYFTPQEAAQFLIAVQQKLLGIGVQLRDDVDGFSVTKIIEGGPADKVKDLKVKDKIIAVNGEPVIGLDVIEVIDRIRGQDGTDVMLRVVREVGQDGKKQQELKDIRIKRGEVVLKEARLEYEAQPFADGAIAYLHLHAFYQDSDSSSSEDIEKAFEEMRKKYKIYGVVLDLRFNGGGVLAQAVAVTGLFINKGVVVSIKDENGVVHHLRDLDSKRMWGGPLIVLTNRGSASAAEIVAQTLQDYGRALVVGDDHTYGKGSFQTFTLTGTNPNSIDPQGEYKVTRGCYYTVSGKTPQLVGVRADIEVPSGLSALDIGEMYGKYPLENDSIPPNFEDSLGDVPLFQREKIRLLYRTDLQKVETKYRESLAQLRKNSEARQKQNKAYQRFLSSTKDADNDMEDIDRSEKYPDYQLYESMDVMKDFITLLQKQAEERKQVEEKRVKEEGKRAA